MFHSNTVLDPTTRATFLERTLILIIPAVFVAIVGAFLKRHDMPLPGIMLGMLLSALVLRAAWDIFTGIRTYEGQRLLRTFLFRQAANIARVLSVLIAIATLVICAATFVWLGISSMFVLMGALLYLVNRQKGSVSSSLMVIFRPFVGTVLVLTSFYCVLSVSSLKRVVVPGFQITEDASVWMIRTEQGVYVFSISAILFTIMFSTRAFFSKRLARSRLAIVHRVQRQLKHVFYDESLDENEKRQRAIGLVLKQLEEQIFFTLSDKILRLTGKSVGTSVWFFTPLPEEHCFQAEYHVPPRNASRETKALFARVRANHRPVMLDKQRFTELINLAKRAAPGRRKKAYLDNSERFKVISVCGWAYDKWQLVASNNARQCCAFNTSYFDEDDKMKRVPDSQKKLLTPGSFIACPVPGSEDNPEGVLIVLKNVLNGFAPEDATDVVVASQMLGKIGMLSDTGKRPSLKIASIQNDFAEQRLSLFADTEKVDTWSRVADALGDRELVEVA